MRGRGTTDALGAHTRTRDTRAGEIFSALNKRLQLAVPLGRHSYTTHDEAGEHDTI